MFCGNHPKRAEAWALVLSVQAAEAHWQLKGIGTRRHLRCSIAACRLCFASRLLFNALSCGCSGLSSMPQR